MKAPASSWPSIAMLTTPTRSQITPPSAPKISGTARRDGADQQAGHRDRRAGGRPGEEAEQEQRRRYTTMSQSGTLALARTTRAGRARRQQRPGCTNDDPRRRRRSARASSGSWISVGLRREPERACRRPRGADEEQQRESTVKIAERDRRLPAARRSAVSSAVASAAGAPCTCGGHFAVTCLGLSASGAALARRRPLGRRAGGRSCAPAAAPR